MKSLTGLPSPVYVRIAQEAGVQFSDLLRLVQEFEAGSTPAYLAYHRPHISAGLTEERLRAIEERLHQFLDLEDRRITILAAISQKDRLTPELRTQIESATDRWELEDLYFPFKPKRRSAADEAIERGLEPLAEALWEQQLENDDLEAAGRSYVNAEKGVATPAAAVRGARQILARRLAEDYGIRQGLRPIMEDHGQLVVPKDQRFTGAAKGKVKHLLGYRSKVKKVSWRQLLQIRCAERESGLRYVIELPENRAVSFVLGRLFESRPATSAVSLQLGDAACLALRDYFGPAFRSELWQRLNDRCDSAAIEVYQRNLEKTLMSPPAGRITVIGLETGRPGGWRAAVVDADGRFVEGAIVYRPAGSDGSEESPAGEPKAENGATNPAAVANGSSDAAVNAPVAPGEGKPAAEVAGKPSEQDSSNPNADVVDRNEAAVVEVPPGDASSDVPQPEREAGEASAEALPLNARDEKPSDEAGSSATAKAPLPGPPVSGKAPPIKPAEEAFVSLSELIRRHEAKAVVMANGPGIRQVETLVRSAIREAGAHNVYWTKVGEAGSWIYATSKVARRDLPDVPVAQRSAACLARRLQDPLAQLIHVEPRLLGVGQFHNEVDQKRLRAGLRAAVECAVHRVGVDFNTAAAESLGFLAGMTERVGKRVVEHRQKNGPFTKREQLLDVAGLSARIYKQAAGFVRVRNGEDPLDNTPVHPDMYPQAEKILAAAGVSAAEALDRPEALDAVSLDEIKDAKHPVELLRGIVDQLRCPRDPRGAFAPPSLPVELRPDDEIQPGKKVEGVVTNIAGFGAFVDIGADQDGLVHVSQMSNGADKGAKPELKIGDRVTVFVQNLEKNGKRISLSLRDPRELARAARRPAARAAAGPPRRGVGPRKRRKEPQRESKITKRSFGPDPKTKAREEQDLQKMSLNEKLELLQTKYRTKV